MYFNSVIFLFFALLFFSLWPIMNKKNRSKWPFLTIMSFVFYGWWDWRFLFLILISGLIDFAAGHYILKKPDRKKTFLIVSLAGNILSLAFFKYSGFFAEMFEHLAHIAGTSVQLKTHLPSFALIVPVGISFYTFQSMSYTIDVYKGKLKPVKNIWHFFAYLSMFPQLVAGPIVRAKDLLKQLAENRIVSAMQKWHALKLIAFGLFQKTVLADNIGVLVNKAYSEGNLETGSLFWWLVLVAFAFQIYCDFSGYSLIAKGLAKYMGYHFKMNFNHPYLSRSFKEFWSRWHISLSSWFRDYVYIPLGGNRKGKLMGFAFMFLTMIISGFWHGPSFHFIAWGFMHAFYLMFERLVKWDKWKPLALLMQGVKMITVFVLVLFAWNFFRANTMHQSFQIIENLFSFNQSSDFGLLYFNAFFFLGLAVLIEVVYAIYSKQNSLRKVYQKLNLDVVFVAFCIVAHLFFRGPESEFIYFQF
jgi:alginate O-acetyltransferase complex protein AlgI